MMRGEESDGEDYVRTLSAWAGRRAFRWGRFAEQMVVLCDGLTKHQHPS